MAGTIRQVMLRKLQVLFPNPRPVHHGRVERILRLLIGDGVSPESMLLKRREDEVTGKPKMFEAMEK